jgi:hypothetical protein
MSRPDFKPGNDMRYIIFAAGVLAILMASLANTLGIDNDAGWGKARLALLLGGMMLCGMALLAHLVQRGALPKSLRLKLSTGRKAAGTLAGRLFACQPISLALGVLVCLGVLVFAAWFASAGKFPAFPPVGNYYIQQGEAFLHGQLALLEKPDPRLLALPNPYDFFQRGDAIPLLWDASLYHGQYFTYWGPVPALMFAVVEGLARVVPASQGLMIFFYGGLAVILLALLVLLRAWFYPQAPGISVALFLAAASINLPYVFLLGRSKVYETSIISGQFFLMLGLLLWVLYLKAGKTIWLVLAGLCWGLAVDSRMTVLVSVGVYTAFAGVHLWRASEAKGLPWRKLAALLAPLAGCALALGWYNWARFGSPLESGSSYQLTLPIPADRLFSVVYLPANLYVWLFYNFTPLELFPFLQGRAVFPNLVPGWLTIPRYQMFERPFLGVLPTLPIFWLLGLLAPLGVTAGWRKRRGRMSGQPDVRWELAGMIALAGLLQFVFLMFFFYGALRYVAEFTLPALLAAAFLVWELDRRLLAWLKLRAALWVGVAGLVLWTVGLGFFGGFALVPELFTKNNPALYHSLALTWTHTGNYLMGLLKIPGIYLKAILRLF